MCRGLTDCSTESPADILFFRFVRFASPVPGGGGVLHIDSMAPQVPSVEFFSADITCWKWSELTRLWHHHDYGNIQCDATQQ